MPLNNFKPARYSEIGKKIQNAITQGFNYITPNTLLAVFLLTSIILAFLQISAITFHIVFGIFIAGYFTNRCFILVLQKKQTEQWKENKNQQ